jgi:hypothetical protein
MSSAGAPAFGEALGGIAHRPALRSRYRLRPNAAALIDIGALSRHSSNGILGSQ